MAQIARKFDVALWKLIAANPGVDRYRPRAGQEIRIPIPTPTPTPVYVFYEVRPGDVFMTIARQFGVDVLDVLAANPDVNRYRLQVGQTIRIPVPTPTPTPTVTPTPDPRRSPTPTPAFFLYEVQPGDVFMTIARRFGVDVLDVLAANPDVNRYELRVGQEIRIPLPTP